MTRSLILLRAALVLLLAAGGTRGGTQAAFAADLKVVVRNIQSPEGKIRVGVFADAATFPKTDQVLAGKVVDATPGEATVVFAGLAPGTYAVSAFQDKNGDTRLNRNLFGMPTEPYGFSRGARGRTGPPSFDDAKFELGPAGAQTVVEIK